MVSKGSISELPKDIICCILEICHVLETVTVSFPPVMENYMSKNLLDLSYVMTNDVNRRISDGLMGKLQHFVIDIPIIALPDVLSYANEDGPGT